jgi:lysyl-tRNA synthetase class 2
VNWRPGATLAVLHARAQLLADLRAYFLAQNIVEVETPLVAQAGVTDPALEPLEVLSPEGRRFLQTSPEYAMKRLLAAGAGDIYQLCKAFRAGEVGKRHNPEYTLLEWYRLGKNHYALAHDVADLLCDLLNRSSWQLWPYRGLVHHFLCLDPFFASQASLEQALVARLGLLPSDLDHDGLLDLAMASVVEPGIKDWGVVVVTDYPASQAALARHHWVQGVTVGARFEVYVDGMELANGYHEAGNAEDLRERFVRDNVLRKRRGQHERPLDERFLAAMAADAMPDCAGVALGVDRLLMCQLGDGMTMDDVLAFPWYQA